MISNRFETLVERSGVQRRKFWWVFELKRTTTQKVTAKKRFFLAKISVARARTFGEGVKFEHYLFWPKNEVSEATQSKFLINLYQILSVRTPL